MIVVFKPPRVRSLRGVVKAPMWSVWCVFLFSAFCKEIFFEVAGRLEFLCIILFEEALVVAVPELKHSQHDVHI